MIEKAQDELRKLQAAWHSKLLAQDREFIRKGGLKISKTENDIQIASKEEISSLTDLSSGENKIVRALKDFLSENELCELISWLRRANNSLRVSSSHDELDSHAKLGEKLVENIKRQIILYYTQDNADDGGYDESSGTTNSTGSTTSSRSPADAEVNRRLLISAAKVATQIFVQSSMNGGCGSSAYGSTSLSRAGGSGKYLGNSNTSGSFKSQSNCGDEYQQRFSNEHSFGHNRDKIALDRNHHNGNNSSNHGSSDSSLSGGEVHENKDASDSNSFPILNEKNVNSNSGQRNCTNDVNAGESTNPNKKKDKIYYRPIYGHSLREGSTLAPAPFTLPSVTAHDTAATQNQTMYRPQEFEYYHYSQEMNKINLPYFRQAYFPYPGLGPLPPGATPPPPYMPGAYIHYPPPSTTYFQNNGAGPSPVPPPGGMMAMMRPGYPPAPAYMSVPMMEYSMYPPHSMQQQGVYSVHPHDPFHLQQQQQQNEVQNSSDPRNLSTHHQQRNSTTGGEASAATAMRSTESRDRSEGSGSDRTQTSQSMHMSDDNEEDGSGASNTEEEGRVEEGTTGGESSEDGGRGGGHTSSASQLVPFSAQHRHSSSHGRYDGDRRGPPSRSCEGSNGDTTSASSNSGERRNERDHSSGNEGSSDGPPETEGSRADSAEGGEEGSGREREEMERVARRGRYTTVDRKDGLHQNQAGAAGWASDMNELNKVQSSGSRSRSVSYSGGGGDCGPSREADSGGSGSSGRGSGNGSAEESEGRYMSTSSDGENGSDEESRELSSDPTSNSGGGVGGGENSSKRLCVESSTSSPSAPPPGPVYNSKDLLAGGAQGSGGTYEKYVNDVRQPRWQRMGHRMDVARAGGVGTIVSEGQCDGEKYREGEDNVPPPAFALHRRVSAGPASVNVAMYGGYPGDGMIAGPGSRFAHDSLRLYSALPPGAGVPMSYPDHCGISHVVSVVASSMAPVTSVVSSVPVPVTSSLPHSKRLYPTSACTEPAYLADPRHLYYSQRDHRHQSGKKDVVMECSLPIMRNEQGESSLHTGKQAMVIGAYHLSPRQMQRKSKNPLSNINSLSKAMKTKSQDTKRVISRSKPTAISSRVMDNDDDDESILQALLGLKQADHLPRGAHNADNNG